MSRSGFPLPFDKTAIVNREKTLLPKFQEIINAIPPEAGFGGIWESEMFLFYAAVAPFVPGQILESGRARGKSTLVLARCFPESRIVSVEFDRDSPNAAAAEAKLRPFPNVEMLYGDSHRILPKRLQNGDAVLIDGPKGFRGLELGLQLLRTGKPCAVFIHDFPPGAPWRKFLERNWPSVFFGDDPLFAQFRSLDRGRDPRASQPDQSGHNYGIFACLPAGSPAPYWRVRFRLMMAKLGVHD